MDFPSFPSPQKISTIRNGRWTSGIMPALKNVKMTMKTKACKEASRDLDQAAGYLQKTSFRGMASSSSSPSSSPSRCLTMFDQCRKPGIGQSSAGSQTLATPLINTSIGNQTLALPETRQKFQSPKLSNAFGQPTDSSKHTSLSKSSSNGTARVGMAELYKRRKTRKCLKAWHVHVLLPACPSIMPIEVAMSLHLLSLCGSSWQKLAPATLAQSYLSTQTGWPHGCVLDSKRPAPQQDKA